MTRHLEVVYGVTEEKFYQGIWELCEYLTLLKNSPKKLNIEPFLERLIEKGHICSRTKEATLEYRTDANLI